MRRARGSGGNRSPGASHRDAERRTVVYHSHTATEAYPSRTDISYASEPDSHYVLVSTRDPDEHELRSYRILDGVVTDTIGGDVGFFLLDFEYQKSIIPRLALRGRLSASGRVGTNDASAAHHAGRPAAARSRASRADRCGRGRAHAVSPGA